MQHLYPQIQFQQMSSDVYRNYYAASNYYLERKEAFLKNIFQKGKGNLVDNEIQLVNDIKGEVNKIWSEKAGQIRGAFFDQNNNKTNTSVTSIMEKTKLFTSEEIDKFDKNTHHFEKKYTRIFLEMLGDKFEQIINKPLEQCLNQSRQMLDDNVNNLIVNFFGQKKSTASIVSGSKNVRPDLMITFGNIDFKTDQNGVLRASTNQAPVELQGTINIDYNSPLEDIISSFQNNFNNIESLLWSEINNYNAFFGLSAKTWGQDIDNKKIMDSSVLTQMLNNIFMQRDKNNRRHAWDIDYAMLFTAKLISQQIFDILGPTNIGFIKADGILWYHNFLIANRLFMRIAVDKISKTPGKIMPKINDNGIYIRALSQSSKDVVRLYSASNKKGRSMIFGLKTTIKKS